MFNFRAIYINLFPRVSVSEQGQNISLAVVRSMGTFGRVSVFFYSQPVTESTVAGQDYSMEDAVSVLSTL